MTSNQPWWLTMPPAELAARILSYFSYQPQEEQSAIDRIAAWCETGSYVGNRSWLRGSSKTDWSGVQSGQEQFEDPAMRAVAEAIQVLEHEGLLMRSSRIKNSGGHIFGGSWVGLTRLGGHALQTNTVRQHLGLSDAPPTANPGGGGTYEPPAL
jgi:hypothetical protein